MDKLTYEYDLIDDNGVSSIELPIKLQVGTIFEHEFGTYLVIEKPEEAPDDYDSIPCDRLSVIDKMIPVQKQIDDCWMRMFRNLEKAKIVIDRNEVNKIPEYLKKNPPTPDECFEGEPVFNKALLENRLKILAELPKPPGKPVSEMTQEELDHWSSLLFGKKN